MHAFFVLSASPDQLVMSHLTVYLHDRATDPCISTDQSFPYRLLQSHSAKISLTAVHRAPTVIFSNSFFFVDSAHVYPRQCFAQSQLNPRWRLKSWQSSSTTHGVRGLRWSPTADRSRHMRRMDDNIGTEEDRHVYPRRSKVLVTWTYSDRKYLPTISCHP